MKLLLFGKISPICSLQDTWPTQFATEELREQGKQRTEHLKMAHEAALPTGTDLKSATVWIWNISSTENLSEV